MKVQKRRSKYLYLLQLNDTPIFNTNYYMEAFWISRKIYIYKYKPPIDLYFAPVKAPLSPNDIGITIIHLD